MTRRSSPRPAPLRPPVARARAALLWERLYPALLPGAGLLLLLLSGALLGLHEGLPWWAHLGVVVLGAASVLVLLRRVPPALALPSRGAALSRVEADSRLPSGTLAALEDKPLGGDPYDPYWRAHQRRLRERIGRVRLDRPRAEVSRLDPFGLRYGVTFLLALSLLVAGRNAGPRLADAVTPALGPARVVVADVWLDPPAYTGRAPVFLSRGEPLPDGTQEERTVPEGTMLRVRLTSPRRAPRARLDVVTERGRERIAIPREEAASVLDVELDANAALGLTAGGRRAVWPVAVTPDRPPSVALTAPPEAEAGTLLRLRLRTEDDYGVSAATLALRLAPGQTLAPDAPTPEEEVLSRTATLPLPAAAGVPGARDVSLDLTEHPFAGLDVLLSVRVEDGAGQADATPPVRVRLPARGFYDPLARTVIEQRRQLAVAPRSWPRTARLLSALTIAPEAFADSTREFLLLRTAYRQVMSSEGEDVGGTIDSFWSLALALEDESLNAARARLEAAEAALRDALARGAPDAEIERLIDELRAAMDDYVAALARSGDAQAAPDGAQLGDDDLGDLLDRIQEASERGLRDEARSLLNQLSRMLENLSIAEGQGQPGGDGEGQGQGEGEPGGAGQGGQGQTDAQGSALAEAGDLIGAQRDLSDDTFAARRGERGAGDLAGRQRALAEGLDALNEAEGGAGAAGASRARDAMRAAARALERGDLGAANALQEEVIASLAEAAEAVRAAGRDGEDEGEASRREQNGEGGGGRTGSGTDPLGRSYGATGIEVPGLSDPERIRDVIETVRRRLADPTLTDAERAYLEGLLERY